jgi:hypothetical protein
MTMRPIVKNPLSSLLRPLALVLACAAGLPGCDEVDGPRPESGEAWIVAQLAAVQDLTPQDQAQHFAAVADDLAVAQAHSEPQTSAPLDRADATHESELAPLECFRDEGCVEWNSQNGCTWFMVCYGCTNGDWDCYGHP